MNVVPDAVIGVEDFAAYFAGTREFDAEKRERAVAAINAATAFVRTATGRTLRSACYREPIAVSGLVVESRDVSPWGGFRAKGTAGLFDSLGIVVDDIAAVVGYDEAHGGRVVAVTPETVTIVPTLPAEASDDLTITFGRGPVYAFGDGGSSVISPEWPVTNVLSAAYRDGTSWIALPTTGVVHDGESRVIEFPYATIPDGARVKLEIVAGYPSPQDSSVFWLTEWEALRRLWLRASEVYLLDDAAHAGRRTSGITVGESGTFTESPMPADVMGLVHQFTRFA